MKVKINGVTLEEASGYCWAFGQYSVMQKVARSLRRDDKLRQSFAEYGVRLGRRQGDAPPKGEAPKGGFKDKIDPKSPDMSAEDAKAQFAGLRKGGSDEEFKARLTDQYAAANDWYRAKTLEAHHIIETSIIRRLGVTDSKLQKDQMTCVLVTAELHRRWYTAGVATSRHEFTEEMDRDEVVDRLRDVYDRLYEGSAMSILRRRAEKIIDKIGRNLSARRGSQSSSEDPTRL